MTLVRCAVAATALPSSCHKRGGASAAVLKILGVHSNAIGDAALTDGHAWLTLHFQSGKSTSIGLWTTSLDESRRFVKDPTGFLLGETFDVEFGREVDKQYAALARRYYQLSEDQARFSNKVLGSFASWRFSNTCASWAARVVRELTGEDLASKELLGYTDTPRSLGNAIMELEKKGPTSVGAPQHVQGNPVLRGSFPAAFGSQSSRRPTGR